MLYRLMLLFGVLAVALMAADAQGTTATPQPEERMIVVTGTAERMVPPDVGLVVFAVETQGNTVGQAVEQNNTVSNRVMDAVNRLNIRGLTMRTLGFDVQPIYEQPGDTRPITRPLRIVGYRVVNRIEARVPETGTGQLSATVGRVLDAALAAGANRVDSISFILEDDLTVQREVLAQATRNARDTAAVLAAAAGVQLGPLMNLSTTPFYRQPPVPLMARTAEAAQGVPIVVGPLTVQASVTAAYQIR